MNQKPTNNDIRNHSDNDTSENNLNTKKSDGTLQRFTPT